MHHFLVLFRSYTCTVYKNNVVTGTKYLIAKPTNHWGEAPETFYEDRSS